MIKEKQKTILVISKQDLLKAGNQVLYRTIEGYLKSGFKIIFLTHEKNDKNLADINQLFEELRENLEIIRIPFKLPKLRKGRGENLKKVDSNIFFDSGTKYPPPPEKSFPFQTEKYNIKHYISQRYFEYLIYKKVILLSKKYQFDIVYAFEVMVTNVSRKISRKLKIPFVVRLEGTFLYHALEAGTAKKLYPIHLRGTKVKADLFIQGNDGTKGLEVLKKLGHPEEKILFITDGIRKDIYQKNLSKVEVYKDIGIEVKKETNILLTLSKLSHWKRHDRIIQAMPRILKRLPETWLLIAHRGPMRSLLEKLVNELGIEKRVIFTGPLPHEKIGQFLNTCDVYINCNDWSNLSNTVLEAMECARPVVSLNDGSLNGIIEDGVNGILVDLPMIKDQFSEKIIQLLSNKKMKKDISKSARVFCEDKILSWGKRMDIEEERVRRLL